MLAGMSSDSFVIKQGDTLPALRRTLLNSDGTPIDLTSATAVRFHMIESGTPMIDEAAVVVPPEVDGVVEYPWAAGDTDTAGVFQAEFEVTFAAGTVITVPNDRFMQVRIAPQAA